MRLIDADTLKKQYTQIFIEAFGVKGAEMFRGVIDQQPTAYDVDNVVEKIGRKSMDNTDGRLASHPKLMGSYISITSDAIDIVKRGGVK